MRYLLSVVRCIASSILLTSGLLFAQVTVHRFEEPPKLKEASPVPAALAALAARIPSPTSCEAQGQVIREGNLVSVQLDYVLADFHINNPDPKDPYGGEDPVRLRSYGGCKAGPTIEVFPGNILRVDLKNKLSADDPSCYATPPIGLSLPALVDCFNTINLHTHGLHVSPAGNSDNVLLNIAPQTEFEYEYSIPPDHPAGTFWYHAHRHGSTAVQVASGASGVLIVRGNRPYAPPTPQNLHPIADIDTILHNTNNAPIPEQLFLFQQIPYACFNNDPNLAGGPWQRLYTTGGLIDVNSDTSKVDSIGNAPWVCPKATPGSYISPGVVENFALQLDSATVWDFNGRFTSVNGIVQPTITLAAGEIQRWRFVHAGIHDSINLQVVRSTPQAGANLITTSAFLGNRLEQRADVISYCAATPQTLVSQFEIAEDGLTRTHIRTIGGLNGGGASGTNYMQPGYRSDVLIAFPEDGDYCLLNQAAYPSERPHNGPNGVNGGGQGPSVPQLLAYIHVRGGHSVQGDMGAYIREEFYNANPQLPAATRNGLRDGNLTPWAPFTELAPAPAANVEQAAFAINFPLFQINGKSYDPNVINFTRQVNTTDEWLLTATGEPHIFHIHVNPFEVIDVTYTGKDGSQESIFNEAGECKGTVGSDNQGLANQYCGMYHVFRDTIFVENGYTVHVRTRYDRYIGEYVIHCHILDHEDAGMMLNIQIVPDLNQPGGGLGMAHKH